MTKQQLIKSALNVLRITFVTYIWIELMCFVIFSAYEGRLFSYSYADNLLKQVAAIAPVTEVEEKRGGKSRQFYIGNSEIHPYLGYAPPGMDQDIGRDFISQPKNPQELTVAIVGGSVPYLLARDKRAMAVLKGKLQEIPAFKDKKIRIISFSMLGYKQPQQLISYSLYQLFDGQIDILINLDGHNEMMETQSNQGSDVFYGYPFIWREFIGLRGNLDITKQTGKVFWFDDMRRDMARSMLRSPLRYSVTASLGWRLADSLAEKYRQQQANQLQKMLKEKLKAKYASGPIRRYDNNKAWQLYAHLWAESSYMLSTLAKAYGTAYFHFIQPIPQWPGKPYSDAEKAMKVRQSGYQKNKVVAYKVLLGENKKLSERGTVAIPLVDMFNQEKNTVYADAICHLTPHGNAMLANKIGDVIAAYYKPKLTAPVAKPLPKSKAPKPQK